MAEELNVDIDFLVDNGLVKYSDGDIVIMDSFHHPQVEETVRLDMLTIVDVVKGQSKSNLNGVDVEAKAGDLVICLPNSYICSSITSSDYEAKVIGLSYEAMQNNMLVSKDMWNIMSFIARNPIVHLSEENRVFVEYFHGLVKYKLEHPHGFYDKEIMQSLFQCAFYELAALIAPLIYERRGTGPFRQGEVLFKRFIEMLVENKSNDRSVKYFAECLCVTPKYLSTVCKSVSGKTALEWIHDFLAEGITRKLKYTDMTIKEIADEMGFPNISFFGKFVKNRFGASPKEYRKRLQAREQSASNN